MQTSTTVDPFERATSTTINRRLVERDTELTVTGIGRVRFLRATTNPRNGATWLDVVDKQGKLRSARPERVTRVHRLSKTRANA
jgi:hypothetical protein